MSQRARRDRPDPQRPGRARGGGAAHAAGDRVAEVGAALKRKRPARGAGRVRVVRAVARVPTESVTTQFGLMTMRTPFEDSAPNGLKPVASTPDCVTTTRPLRPGLLGIVNGVVPVPPAGKNTLGLMPARPT